MIIYVIIILLAILSVLSLQIWLTGKQIPEEMQINGLRYDRWVYLILGIIGIIGVCILCVYVR